MANILLNIMHKVDKKMKNAVPPPTGFSFFFLNTIYSSIYIYQQKGTREMAVVFCIFAVRC